jgi:hypothetical protein
MYCPIGHNYRKSESGQIEVMETAIPALCRFRSCLRAGIRLARRRRDSIPQLNKELVEFIDRSARPRRSSPCRRRYDRLHHSCRLVGRLWQRPTSAGARFGDRWMARASNRIMTQTGASPNS